MSLEPAHTAVIKYKWYNEYCLLPCSVDIILYLILHSHHTISDQAQLKYDPEERTIFSPGQLKI